VAPKHGEVAVNTVALIVRVTASLRSLPSFSTIGYAMSVCEASNDPMSNARTHGHPDANPTIRPAVNGKANVASLLVPAICIPLQVSGLAPRPFAVQIIQLAVYVPAVLLGLGWIAKKLFALKPSKEGQFALLLLLVALAAVAAEAINLEGIIGAFLAGLAVNTATRDSEAKHELEFIGNHLFIPVFFVTIGFLIDL
jgi:hypothetical protein